MYVVVATARVLIVAGDHVPVIDGILLELVGKAGAVLLSSNGPIAAKVGVMLLVVVISMVTAVAH